MCNVNCNEPEYSYWPCSSLYDHSEQMWLPHSCIIKMPHTNLRVWCHYLNLDKCHEELAYMKVNGYQFQHYQTEPNEVDVNGTYSLFTKKSTLGKQEHLKLNTQDNVNADSFILSASYSLESPNTTMNLLWSSWLACRWLTLFMISRC